MQKYAFFLIYNKKNTFLIIFIVSLSLVTVLHQGHHATHLPAT